MKSLSTNKGYKSKMQAGFTLIEVLVALLVLSVGLLGLAALQATSLKTNHGAYTRGQAIFLAYDIMDRMRANRNQAQAGAYNRKFNDPVPNAGGLLWEQDLDDWLSNYVQVLLPDGKARIDCDPNPANSICTVTMQWNEARLGGSASNQAVNTTEFQFQSQI